jgi:hypothetical protein
MPELAPMATYMTLHDTVHMVATHPQPPAAKTVTKSNESCTYMSIGAIATLVSRLRSDCPLLGLQLAIDGGRLMPTRTQRLERRRAVSEINGGLRSPSYARKA